jgi:hypothetical protein
MAVHSSDDGAIAMPQRPGALSKRRARSRPALPVKNSQSLLTLTQGKLQRLEADLYDSKLALAAAIALHEVSSRQHDAVQCEQQEQIAALTAQLAGLRASLQRTTEADIDQIATDALQQTVAAATADQSEQGRQASDAQQQDKLLLWAAATRDRERAEARVRYEMTAYLQRYVCENELLRRQRAAAVSQVAALTEALEAAGGSLAQTPAQAARQRLQAHLTPDSVEALQEQQCAVQANCEYLSSMLSSVQQVRLYRVYVFALCMCSR